MMRSETLKHGSRIACDQEKADKWSWKSREIKKHRSKAK